MGVISFCRIFLELALVVAGSMLDSDPRNLYVYILRFLALADNSDLSTTY